MQRFWTADTRQPGDPYDHNRFRQYFSDYDPVPFELVPVGADDD